MGSATVRAELPADVSLAASSAGAPGAAASDGGFVVEVSGDQATAVHVQAGQVAVQASSRTRGIGPKPPVTLDTQADGGYLQ